MSMVFSSGMLRKKESTSRLPVKNPEPYSIMLFSVYSLLVKNFK